MASSDLTNATSRASPMSVVDKEALLDIIKEHIEVLNDKTTKFYATNKKARAWQEISNKFCDLTGHMKTPQQLRKIWENIKNRAKKEHSRVKAQRGKTGGGPPPKPLDTFSNAVLPLLEEELEPHSNVWDNDHGHHEVVMESGEDGSVTFSLSQEEDTQEFIPASLMNVVPTTLPVLPPAPTTASNCLPQPQASTSAACPPLTPSTILQSSSGEPASSTKKRLTKRKLVTSAKEEALRLATERNHASRITDRELHQERIRLIEFEKEKISAYYNFKMEQEAELYALKKELVLLKIKNEKRKYHDEEVGSV